jgi:hypothetical protein
MDSTLVKFCGARTGRRGATCMIAQGDGGEARTGEVEGGDGTNHGNRGRHRADADMAG